MANPVSYGMKTLFDVIYVTALIFVFSLVSFADEGIDHAHDGESDVAAIDPTFIVGAIGIALIGGFIIWKFLLSKK